MLLHFFAIIKQHTSINQKNDDINCMLQQMENTEINEGRDQLN